MVSSNNKLEGLVSWGLPILGGLCVISALILPNVIYVRGSEEVSRNGSSYVVQYDKRDNGVILRSSDGGMDNWRLVDTNYDGVADYVDSLAGKKPVSQTAQNLFSQVTSNFYKKYPTKESVLKK